MFFSCNFVFGYLWNFKRFLNLEHLYLSLVHWSISETDLLQVIVFTTRHEIILWHTIHYNIANSIDKRTPLKHSFFGPVLLIFSVFIDVFFSSLSLPFVLCLVPRVVCVSGLSTLVFLSRLCHFACFSQKEIMSFAI